MRITMQIDGTIHELEDYNLHKESAIIEPLIAKLRLLAASDNESNRIETLKLLFPTPEPGGDLIRLKSIRKIREKLTGKTTNKDLDQIFSEIEFIIENELNHAWRLSQTLEYDDIQFIDNPTRPSCPFKSIALIYSAVDYFATNRQCPDFEKKDLAAQIASVPVRPLSDEKVLNTVMFSHANHRTGIFSDPSFNDGRVMAIKVRKRQETPADFAREYQTLMVLRKEKSRLNLRSDYHEPAGVQPFGSLPLKIQEDLQKNLAHIQEIDWKDTEVYISYPHESYYQYIQNIENDQDFINSFVNSLHDDIQLLKEGLLFDELIDLLHNDDLSRNEQGKYMVLVSLARGGSVPGRLHEWMKTVVTPNMGKTGLRDFNEYKILSEFSKNPQYETVFRAIKSNYLKSMNLSVNFNTDDIDNKSLANFLMNHLALLVYVVNLVTMKRFFATQLSAGKSAMTIYEDKAGWEHTSELMLQILTEVLHLQGNANTKEFGKTINFSFLTEQMRYWICIFHALENKEPVPDSLLTPNTIQMYGVKQCQNLEIQSIQDYNSVKYISQGTLGFTNSINPITEVFKLAMAFSLLMFNQLVPQKRQKTQPGTQLEKQAFAMNWLNKCDSHFIGDNLLKFAQDALREQFGIVGFFSFDNLFDQIQIQLFSESTEQAKKVHYFYTRLYQAKSKEEISTILDRAKFIVPQLESAEAIHFWLRCQGGRIQELLESSELLEAKFPCWWDKEKCQIDTAMQLQDQNKIDREETIALQQQISKIPDAFFKPANVTNEPTVGNTCVIL